MFKEYIKEQGMTIRDLSQKTGVPYSTLNDLVNGKIKAENCKAGVLYQISAVLDKSMDDVYRMLSQINEFTIPGKNIQYRLCVQNKRFYVTFPYQDDMVSIDLCRQKREIMPWIQEIAENRVTDYIWEKEMEVKMQNGLLVDEKK